MILFPIALFYQILQNIITHSVLSSPGAKSNMVIVEDNTSTHTELTLNYQGNCYQKLQTQQQSIKLTNGLLLWTNCKIMSMEWTNIIKKQSRTPFAFGLVWSLGKDIWPPIKSCKAQISQTLITIVHPSPNYYICFHSNLVDTINLKLCLHKDTCNQLSHCHGYMQSNIATQSWNSQQQRSTALLSPPWGQDTLAPLWATRYNI